MLENIREKSQGGIAKVILGFIIVTFAVAGIGSYTNSVDTSVAVVNGEKISRSDFEKAYQNQRARMEQQFGQMFETLAANPSYMANFRNGVLENLINEALIDQSTNALSIRISDEFIKETIRKMPEFQVDGVFDNNRYIAVINQAGFYQSTNFRDYLREQMSRRQLSQALVASEFNLPYQEEMESSLQNQQRDLNLAVISTEQFKAGIEVSDEEINQYFLANQENYKNEEKAKVNYLLVDVNEISKGITVSDEEVNQYYQDNITSFRQVEQRQIAHILIEFGDDESAAETQANQVRERLIQGEDFALLAKELSADTGSGENGGELGWLSFGDMDPVFDDAAFSITTKNELSALVKTDYGFHIIKLLDIKPEVTKSLDEVKDELLAKVQLENARDEFFKRKEVMGQLSFEHPDNLSAAATELNIEILTSDWISRFNNGAPFDDSRLTDAVFSDLVLTENVNSDVIEINDNLAVVVHLNEYQAAEVKSLSEVSNDIKALLVSNKLRDKALANANELLTQLKAGTDITETLLAQSSAFTLTAGVTRNKADIEQSVRKEAFVLPHPQEGVVVASVAELSNGDFALLELKAVNEGSTIVNPNLGKQQVSQLSQSAYQSYIEALKSKAEISRKSLTEEVSTI